MGELVKLKNAVIEGVDTTPEPDPNIVSYLEGKLEQARQGKLIAFAFVGVDDRLNAVNSFYIGDPDARSEVVAHVAYLGVGLALDAGNITTESEETENGC